MQINIQSFEKILKVGYFKIEIEEKNHGNFTFLSRYSELLEIHQQFKKDNKKNSIPEFPPKQLFGSENEQFMEQRKKSLENYFSNILKYKDQLKFKMNAWNEFFRQKRQEEIESSGNKKASQDANFIKNNEIARGDDLSSKTPSDISKKDKAEVIYENFARQLVFLELKALNRANYKKKNITVENSDPSSGFNVMTEEDIANSGLSDFIKACLGVSSELESVLFQNGEIEKKKYFQEFHHQFNFGNSVNIKT